MSKQLLAAKTSLLKKRIESFSQGYRQNLVLLSDDPEELSYILKAYLQDSKPIKNNYIALNAIYSGKIELLKAVSLSLLSNYTRKSDNLDNLLYCANPTLPLTTSFIQNCLKKEKIAFFDLLECINIFITESKENYILIVEEFLKVGELFSDFYQNFPKFIISQKSCMVVLTSSKPKKAQKILSNELNLLFGNFEKHLVNTELISESFCSLKDMLDDTKPSPSFLSLFINITGSNITYYNSISKSIKNTYNPLNENKSIVDALDSAIYNEDTYIFQKFIKKIDLLKATFKDFLPMLKLLISLSEGYLRKNELASLNICPNKELSTKLQKMIDLGYVNNHGNIYKIKDSLFSFWLSHIFKFRCLHPTLNSSVQYSNYQQKVYETITSFNEDFAKDKLKKIIQLFSVFKDDRLCFGANKYSLPSLSKTKIMSYPKRNFHLIIGEGKDIVFAGVKENDSEDTDIIDFIDKGANINGKRVRKIFISLGEIPQAARLIAKNNKLTVWDKNDINRLLSVYNKPICPE